MHLADQVGRCKVQFVVASVYVNALVVKPRADRAVEHIDVFGIQYFAKVLHNEKASPNSETFQIRSVMQLFSGLFYVVASRVNSPRSMLDDAFLPIWCQAVL